MGPQPIGGDPVVDELEVPSPCVRLCTLDEDICVGCGRHIREIVGWSAADPAGKRRIVAAAQQRLAERQQRYSGRL